MISLVTRGNVETNMIGIATPYRAQVRSYLKALQEIDQAMPINNFLNVVVGTTEFWQGKDKKFMFIDFFRGSNDQGSIGSLVDRRRANVLITRQKIAWFLVADLDCVLSNGYGLDEPEMATEVKVSKEAKTNEVIIKIFNWFRTHGRVVDVSEASLGEEFVKFKSEEYQNPGGNESGD